MNKLQHEQVVLNEQFKIIKEQANSLPKESQDIIKKALGEICNIEMAWGMLLSIDIATYEGLLNKEESIELIKWLEDNIDFAYLKEMKKDLKFIYEGENE